MVATGKSAYAMLLLDSIRSASPKEMAPVWLHFKYFAIYFDAPYFLVVSSGKSIQLIFFPEHIMNIYIYLFSHCTNPPHISDTLVIGPAK